MKSLFQLAGDVLSDLSRFVDRLAARVRGGAHNDENSLISGTWR